MPAAAARATPGRGGVAAVAAPAEDVAGAEGTGLNIERPAAAAAAAPFESAATATAAAAAEGNCAGLSEHWHGGLNRQLTACAAAATAPVAAATGAAVR